MRDPCYIDTVLSLVNGLNRDNRGITGKIVTLYMYNLCSLCLVFWLSMDYKLQQIYIERSAVISMFIVYVCTPQLLMIILSSPEGVDTAAGDDFLLAPQSSLSCGHCGTWGASLTSHPQHHRHQHHQCRQTTLHLHHLKDAVLFASNNVTPALCTVITLLVSEVVCAGSGCELSLRLLLPMSPLTAGRTLPEFRSPLRCQHWRIYCEKQIEVNW